MYVNPIGIWVVLGVVYVVYDLTSSTHEAKKDQGPKEENGKVANHGRYIIYMHIMLCALK